MLRKLATGEDAPHFGVSHAEPLRESVNEMAPETVDAPDRAVSVGYHLSDRVLEDLKDRRIFITFTTDGSTCCWTT